MPDRLYRAIPLRVLDIRTRAAVLVVAFANEVFRGEKFASNSCCWTRWRGVASSDSGKLNVLIEVLRSIPVVRIVSGVRRLEVSKVHSFGYVTSREHPGTWNCDLTLSGRSVTAVYIQEVHIKKSSARTIK